MRDRIRKLQHLWKNLTERDSLIIMKLISSSIYQFRFVKFLLILYLIVQLSSQIVQIYLFAYELNAQQFLQYSSTFLIVSFGILVIILHFFEPRIVEDLFDEMVVEPIDAASETIPIATLLVISTALSTCAAGQSIETVTEDLHETLKQIKWYNMNVENRKIYSIILSATQRGVSIRFSENYSINYAMGLAVARGTYSVMSVLATFNPPSST